MSGRVPSYANQELRLIREILGQYGVKDTSATWRRIPSMRLDPQPTIETDPFSAAGDAVPSLMPIVDDYSEGDVEGRADYETLPYILSSLFGAATISTPGGATNTRDWNWTWTGSGVTTAQTYLMNVGTIYQSENVPGAMFNGLTISGDREGMELSSSIWGMTLDPDVGLGGYSALVQTITLLGNPTGGTFDLYIPFETEGLVVVEGLAFDADATALTAAIDGAMPGSWEAAVAGGPLPGTATVTFSGGTGRVGLMWGDEELLTGGDEAAREVRVEPSGTPTDSATNIQPKPMFPLHWSIFMDNAWADLGETRLRHAYEMDMGFGDKYERTKPINRLRDSDNYVEIADQDHTVTLNLAVNRKQSRILKEVKEGQQKFVRLEAIGPEIESGFNYTYRQDLSLFIEELGAGEELNNIYAREFTFRLGRDNTSGFATKAFVRCTRTAL